MKTSENGLALIRRFEGLNLTAFWDVDGWSIGYGHHSNVRKGQKITKAQAEAYLRQDVKKCEKFINGSPYISWQLNQNQFDALVSFAFNLGGEKIRTLCEKRSAATVADKLLLYNKAGGRVLQGLVARRRAERALFLGGEGCPYAMPEQTVSSAENAERMGCKNVMSRGEGVCWVQWQLKKVGYDLMVDGVCGALTTAAIRDFQSREGLTVDGLCGAQTKARLMEK